MAFLCMNIYGAGYLVVERREKGLLGLVLLWMAIFLFSEIFQTGTAG